MKKTAVLAAIPFTLTLAACGEPIDGSDTADLEGDATEVESTGTEYEPGEDGLLQNDVVPDDMEPVEDSTMEADEGKPIDPMLDDEV